MGTLQIYVYGPQTNGFLDLNHGSKLDLEGITPLFAEDLTIGEYSLPLDVPYTENNIRLLGFANVPQNFANKDVYFKIDVYDSGVPEMQNAKMTILDKTGFFNTTNGSFKVTISGTKGLYGSMIRNKKLTDLVMGGAITWETYDSRQFAVALMKGLFPQYDYIGFAPVGFDGFFDKDRKDFSTEFLAKDTVNNIIKTGSGADDWTFARPDSTTEAPVSPGAAEYVDYRTIPFFKFKYILNRCFEEFGFTLTGEFVNTSAFNDLYLFNNYSIEQYSGNYDITRSILPKNHMPDMLIKDFLQAVCSTFNMYPLFSGTTTVELVYRKNIFTDIRLLDLAKLIYNPYTLTPQSTDNAGGYTIEYSFDSNDNIVSDRVQLLDDKIVVATVAQRSDLDTLNIGRTFTIDDVVLVKAENIYYKVANATTIPVKFDAFIDNLNTYEVGAKSTSYSLPIAPLTTYVILNTGTGLYESQHYCGVGMKGSYQNSKNIRVKNPFGLRMFYIQKNVLSGPAVPYTLYHNRSLVNDVILPYSLSLYGSDGMVESFHKDWRDRQTKTDILKSSIHIDRKVQLDLSQNSIYEIKNVRYLPYSIQRTIPMGNQADIQLLLL